MSSRFTIRLLAPILRSYLSSFQVPLKCLTTCRGIYRHSIYKWHHKAARPRERAISFTGPSTSNAVDPTFEHIHEPGGFRRNFLKLKASEQGVDHPTFVNNFIDFLFIFGHFVRGPSFSKA